MWFYDSSLYQRNFLQFHFKIQLYNFYDDFYDIMVSSRVSGPPSQKYLPGPEIFLGKSRNILHHFWGILSKLKNLKKDNRQKSDKFSDIFNRKFYSV